MQAGKLRNRINILHATKSKNAVGETVEDTEIVKSVRCEIVTNVINKESVADGVSSLKNKVFRIRFIKWIEPEHLIEFENRVYTIIDIDNPKHRNRELIITAEAV